jgi:hypothetical protein
MRTRDLKQISQLRKLREDEQEKNLAKARAVLTEAERALHAAERERDQAREKAMTEEAREWNRLSHATTNLAPDALDIFYLKIAQRKTAIVELRKQVKELGEKREEAHTGITEAQKDFFTAQRNKDRWENFRDKLDEEALRKEEIHLEENNSEIKLKPPAKPKNRP